MRLHAVLLCLLAQWMSLHGHDLHQSTAEAEYNPATHKLEVSLTVFINDLELALIRHAERLISFDKTPAAELDAVIQSYLAKTFVVTDATGKVAKLEWVGRQADQGMVKGGDVAITLFFQAAIPDVRKAAVRNSVLCDLFQDQTNLLQLSIESEKVQLTFSCRDAVKNIGAFSRDGRERKKQ